MLLALMLWAEEEAAKPAAPSPFGMLPALILIFVLFYFMLIRPAQRRERQAREMINNNLKKNAEVVTSGGIIGVITNIKENGEEVTIRIDDNAKMRVLRSSIVRILSPIEAADGKPADKIETNIQARK